MVDPRLLRTDLAGLKAAIARRGDDTSELDEAAELESRRTELSQERDELRSRIKVLSREVGALHKAGRSPEAGALADESRELGEREGELAVEVDEAADGVRRILLGVGNLPADDCPDGDDETDNVVLRTEGFDSDAYGDHQRKPHWEIGAELGVLDVERAVKLSGAMFVMYRGLGATLARALCQFALDRNTDLYEEIRPPQLVLTETMVNTGQLPKFADDAYHLERDELWAIPTAEAPLTSVARDEILDEADLPMRMTAHTSCYRREAGAAGKDTRGLLRVHEFDKVELLAYATPDQAASVHEEQLARAERLLVELGLAYRVVDLCTGDIGISARRTWDLEVFAPGVDRWLEVSSVTWFGDYQARRANIRYRPGAPKAKPELVHTLNGSALAVPRVWAAVTETHRRPDGSVALPEPLHPYLRGATEIPAP